MNKVSYSPNYIWEDIYGEMYFSEGLRCGCGHLKISVLFR